MAKSNISKTFTARLVLCISMATWQDRKEKCDKLSENAGGR